MKEAKKSFEDQWSTAFEGAEMSPSEHVWTSIDGVLANQQASGFKKRILFFKWVAAASIGITITALSILWIQNSNDTTQLSETRITNENNIQETENLTIESSTPKTENKDNTLQNNDLLVTEENSTNENRDLNNTIENIQKSTQTPFTTTNSTNEKVLFASLTDSDTKNTPLIIEEQKANSFSTLNRVDAISISFDNEYKPRVIEKLYGVANPYLLENIEDNNDEFGLWAGVSMSSGSFNPNTNNGISSDANSLSYDIQEGFSEDVNINNLSSLQDSYNNESLNAGNSISVGIDLSGRVSKKVILTSGIHYQKNTTILTSELLITDSNGNSFASLSNDVSDSGLRTKLANGTLSSQSSTTDFNNDLQYISIPFKVGWIVLDKKINITFNSGVSTNFLLNTQLNSSSGQTQLFNTDNSFSKEFRPVYLNFLSSVSIGYTFHQKYIFSLEPNYSQAITDFTKTENFFKGKPNNFSVAVGLKYNF